MSIYDTRIGYQATYTHVECDGDEHGLIYQHNKWPGKNMLNALTNRHRLPFQRGPVAVIAGLFAQLLRALHEKDRPVDR